jgi:hypothetical protein
MPAFFSRGPSRTLRDDQPPEGHRKGRGGGVGLLAAKAWQTLRRGVCSWDGLVFPGVKLLRVPCLPLSRLLCH